jgi:hypothetical protein
VDPSASGPGGTVSMITHFAVVAQKHLLLSVILPSVVTRSVVDWRPGCGKYHAYRIPGFPQAGLLRLALIFRVFVKGGSGKAFVFGRASYLSKLALGSSGFHLEHIAVGCGG